MVGVPAAATKREFEEYVISDGSRVQGHPQRLYVAEALEVVGSKELNARESFLGVALWAFAPQITYPLASENVLFPSTPFESVGERPFLRANLTAPTLNCTVAPPPIPPAAPPASASPSAPPVMKALPNEHTRAMWLWSAEEEIANDDGMGSGDDEFRL